MATHTGSFALSAWIVGTRWKHHRLHDHFGGESDDFVILSRRIGPYEEQTPIHTVLADLVARVIQLETSDQHRTTFTLDAAITRNCFTLDAVLARAGTAASFTLDAFFNRGARFTFDAVIRGGGTFTFNAFIV